MLNCVEHREADRRVPRHIKKWLNAGVLENGEASVPGVRNTAGRKCLAASATGHHNRGTPICQTRTPDAEKGDICSESAELEYAVDPGIRSVPQLEHSSTARAFRVCRRQSAAMERHPGWE
jgi:hypothetical protein